MQKDTEIGITSFFGDRAYPLKVHQFPGHFHVKKQSYISQNRCILYFSKNKLVHLANKSKPCYIVMQKDTEIGIMSFFGDRAYPLKVHQFPGHFHVKKHSYLSQVCKIKTDHIYINVVLNMKKHSQKLDCRIFVLPKTAQSAKKQKDARFV